MTAPKKNDSSQKSAEEGDSTLPPVLVDLGKARRSRVRDLKRGKGRLMERVEDVIEDTIDELGNEAEGKTILPVVIIVERRPKKQKIRSLLDFAIPSRD